MPNAPVFESHLNLMVGQSDHLIMGQMDAILFSYVLVWHSNGWSSTLDINRSFEYQTNWNLNFKKLGIQMFPVFKWSVFRTPLYLTRMVLKWLKQVRFANAPVFEWSHKLQTFNFVFWMVPLVKRLLPFQVPKNSHFWGHYLDPHCICREIYNVNYFKGLPKVL